MSNNPYFELEQVEQYLEYLSTNPADLEKTVETHFFPVLQKIFFYHAYEVRPKARFAGRDFPFECVDVLGGRRRILVHFSFTHAKASTLPYFALTWGDDQDLRRYPTLLVVQNRATDTSLTRIKNARAHWVSVLDFSALGEFARDGFERQLARESSVYVTLVREMMEALAVKIADGPVTVEELEWRDVEKLLGTVMQGLGFKCIVTPPSRDKGSATSAGTTSPGTMSRSSTGGIAASMRDPSIIALRSRCARDGAVRCWSRPAGWRRLPFRLERRSTRISYGSPISPRW